MTTAKPYDHLLKLMLIGESGVGKSSLLVRFADDTFDPSGTPTIGIDFKLRTIELNGERVRLQLLDTAGQERFRTITNAHYRNAMGVMIVYDVTDEKSFSNVTEWLKNVERYSSGPVDKLLIGNKRDLVNKRQVSTERGMQLADELGMKFFETSACTKDNVEKAFFEISRDIIARMGHAKTNEKQTVKIGGEAPEKQKSSKKCC